MFLRVYAEALLVLSDADATCVCKFVRSFSTTANPNPD